MSWSLSVRGATISAIFIDWVKSKWLCNFCRVVREAARLAYGSCEKAETMMWWGPLH